MTLVTITTDGGTFQEKVNRDPLSWAQNVITNGYVRRTPAPGGTATDIAIYPPSRIILVTFSQPKQ